MPSVRQYGLPALREAIRTGLSLNDSLVHSLICLMTVAEDSTVLNHAGMNGLLLVQQTSSQAMVAGGMLTETGRQRIAAMDSLFTAAGISPGGAADLLAATYFIYNLENSATEKDEI